MVLSVVVKALRNRTAQLRVADLSGYHEGVSRPAEELAE